MKIRILGIIILIIGLALSSFAGIYGLYLKQLIQAHQIYILLVGLPLFFLGISFLFINKPDDVRKKASLYVLLICLFLLILGIFSSFIYRIPGGRIELIFATFLFNFTYIPLLTKSRYQKWSNYVGSIALARVLTAVDMISIILMALGGIFRIQHWPGADALLTTGVIFIIINMLGWNRILGQQLVLRKTAEEKLEKAHESLKEKSDEIIDSINYAKRIQTAILPPDKQIKEHLKNSFVLYKPKDIVAGDFYWMEPQENGVLFAAADCTGHGVPGAMVSVICNHGLNRSVREFGLTDPGKILTKTRELVISEFDKSEEEVKDGMDIALCSLNGNTLKFAGAHNPLWIIRKGATEVEEVKADKQPIGKYADASPFKTHDIEMQSGDSIYIFSDGFSDQFGGEKGKKFKAKNFKALLLSIQNESIERQKVLIDEAFENWKGTLEQLDDVCVIGMKF